MLSSTVVTVLAPHWGSRTRRTKKADGPLSPGAVWNIQDPNNYPSYSGVTGSFTSGSQEQMRVPSLGPRSNTVDWSTKSEPFSLDSRRKITQTTSLDSTSGRMDNQKRDGRAESLLTPMASQLSPFHPQNEQQGPSQTIHPARLSPSSSKPTTSSLLLSLRRFNSDGRSPAPLNNSLSDTNGKSFSTHLAHNFNKNEQERSKSSLSSTNLSSPSSDERQWTQPDSTFFPTSPVGRDAAESPFTKHSQPINKTQSNFTFRSSTNKEMPDGLKNGTPPLHMEATISSPRHASYTPSPLQKTHIIPRPTLTSTSWWKQVAHEGSRNVTTNTTEMPNTPFLQAHHDNQGKLYLNSNDSKGLGSQIPSNRNNNNTVDSIYTGNMNLIMQTQGCVPDLKQKNADYLPSRDSDRIATQHNHGNPKSRDPPKAESMPVVVFSHKMSRAPSRSQIHRDDPFKNEAGSSFRSAQSPAPFSNSRSSNMLFNNNSSNQYNPNSPISPTNKFVRASPSPDFTNTSNSQVFSTVPTPKTNICFQFPPSSAQSASQSHNSTSSQTRKFSEKSNTSPLGFERSYASLPKPIHPKMVSSLMSTITSSNKTKYIPLSTSSVVSSSTSNSPPVSSSSTSTALSSESQACPSVSSFLTPPVTPVSSSEVTTIKGRKVSSHSLERQPKKRPETEFKKQRRVTWHNSVDVKCSESTKTDKPSSFPSARSVDNTQSVFPSLKPDNPTSVTCPISPTTTPKTSNIHETRCGKTRSLSSDSGDLASKIHESKKQGWGDSTSFDLQRHDSTTQRQERNHLAETDSLQIRTHAPLSLPPDFARSYQHRYSSPPYSTLMSSRLAQGECRTLPLRSPLFSKPPHSNYTKPLSGKADINLRAPSSSSTAQSPSSPIQNPPATKVNGKNVIPETEAKTNLCSVKIVQLNQPIYINNRVNSSPQAQQNKKVQGSSSVCTLDTPAPATSQRSEAQPVYEPANTVVSAKTNPNTQHAIKPENGRCGFSDRNLSGSCSTDSQLQASEKKIEGFFGKSKCTSLNSNQEQSPKKSWFSLKKSVSTPSASLSRTESERTKSGKMDQVLNRLRQKLSMRQSTDDPSFPRKWRRSSETPSLGGTSDVSNFSDISDDSVKTLEEGQEKNKDPKDGRQDKDSTDRWTQNRYDIIPYVSTDGTAPGDSFSSRSLEPAPISAQKPNSYEDNKADNPGQHHLSVHIPVDLESNSCKDNRKVPNLLLPCSPCRSPNPSHRKSSLSPRSPFSPFGSLSPHSPLSLTDAADEVFYSPKLNRRKETASPQPTEGLSLTGSRKSRASTGPPSLNAAPNSDSSYADLKYGIEPGRTFSVSSVLSSRPSGPGRISTGSRFMSVGDLSQANMVSTGQYSATSDWTTEVDGKRSTHASDFLSDAGKMRSRSLPRSFSRRLSNWSSDSRDPQPLSTLSVQPSHLQDSNMSFEMGTEEPLTPPPTPPLSPVSRRMSKPPSPTSTSLSNSSGSPKSGDSPSSRGHLPSRGYVSSLSTFEESSDSSSDTTTDDEYYLETDDDGERETEL